MQSQHGSLPPIVHLLSELELTPWATIAHADERIGVLCKCLCAIQSQTRGWADNLRQQVPAPSWGTTRALGHEMVREKPAREA
jgi:hypothetical protein